MKTTNLFRYATSELSQDAFICWLLSHATKEGYDDDYQIRECAIEFIKEILKSKNITWFENMRITTVEKQYKNIDVLVVINDLYIIIEDKTFTSTHNDQINRYKKTLIEQGYYGQSVNEDKVICVYYKTIEQPHPEQNVDIEFTRDTILNILRNHKDRITNQIFIDYLEYLEYINCDVNNYKESNIESWNDNAYRGFFKDLGNTFFKDKGYDWGYVANQTGGFMGLWWYDIFSNDDFHKMELSENVVSNLYLQLEKDEIVIKYSVAQVISPNYSIIKDIRWKIYGYLKNELGDDFHKKIYRNGRYMTVGYIKYNRDNCVEILTKMQEILLKMRGSMKFGKENING